MRNHQGGDPIFQKAVKVALLKRWRAPDAVNVRQTVKGHQGLDLARIEGPVFAVHQSDATLDAMDAWNKGTHGKSGLIDRVKGSQIGEAQAEAMVLDFLRRYVPSGRSPMCGNSICQDRRFLARQMPQLEKFFHYRNLDVSTLKELARRWAPAVSESFQKTGAHLALADIHESIRELRHYRANLFAQQFARP